MTDQIEPLITRNSVVEELAQNNLETQLHRSRAIMISEGVGSSTAQKVVSALLLLDEESTKPIKLYINSPGGEVNSGFAIFDTIRFIKSPVYVVNCGLCASIATIINVAVPAKRRYSLPNSRFLIHQPLISGQVQGQASDIEITANEILKTREKINRILSEECQQKFDKVEEDTLRDYWMTASEALEYGLIHKVIQSKDELNIK